jgi:hypothetical protein
MTQAPALSTPTRVELRRRHSGTEPGASAGLDAVTRGRAGPTGATALSQARRDQNRKELGVAAYLRCECGAPACRATCPAAADGHRGLFDGFIVTPAHLGASTVVRAADRFFIVEPDRAGRR